MKRTIKLTASERSNNLYVHMHVYAEKAIVPVWSITFQLYRVTAERIMNIFYEHYLYTPMLLCSRDKLEDCKQWMSKWLTNYKRRHSIEGIANWKYELEF